MSNDPYAAPTANLDNNLDAAQIPSSIWNAKGRLSVLSYLAQSLVVMLITTIILGGLFAIGSAMTGASLATIETINWSNPVVIVLGILAVVIYLVVIYITVCMMIKRLHDRNHNGWWSLGLFIGSIIPFVNLVAIIGFIYVIFFPGQKTGNRYGGRRETKGWEKVLGILYLVLVIGSIVFAFVAGGAAFMNAG